MVKNQFEDTPFWKRIHQTKIADWFRANVILDVAKNGCVSYIETKLSRLHEHILRAVSDKGIKCYECSTRNIVPCPTVGICSSWNPPNTCSYHNSYVERYRKCPNGICDKFRLEIEKLHTQQAPSWQNTSAENWCKDPWEVAKCFIGPDGYGHIRSSDETDFRGLLNILIYCKPCRTDLSAVESLSGYLLSQIRELEWKVRRPALLEMDESDFKALFINMEKFLQQMVKLRSFDDSTAVDAIGHLQMIQDDCYVPSAIEENLLLMKAFMIINVHLATCGIPLPSQDIDDEFGVQKEPRGLLLSLRTAVEKEQQQLLQVYDEDDGVCDEIQVVTNVQITLNDIVSACLPQELNDWKNMCVLERIVLTGDNLPVFAFTNACLQGLFDRSKECMDKLNITIQMEDCTYDVLFNDEVYIYASKTVNLTELLLHESIETGSFKVESFHDLETNMSTLFRPMVLITEAMDVELLNHLKSNCNMKAPNFGMVFIKDEHDYPPRLLEELGVLYATFRDGSILNTVDELLERILFRILRPLTDQLMHLNQDCENELLLDLQDDVKAAYGRSQIPMMEQPTFSVHDDDHSNDGFNKAIGKVLQIPAVFGCGCKHGKMVIYFNESSKAQYLNVYRTELKELLQKKNIFNYSIEFISIHHYANIRCGDQIFENCYGTLGCFAEKYSKVVSLHKKESSQQEATSDISDSDHEEVNIPHGGLKIGASFQKLSVTDNTIYEREPVKTTISGIEEFGNLVALISKHVASAHGRQRTPLYVNGQKIGHVDQIHNEMNMYDIVAANIYERYNTMCDTRLRDSRDRPLPAVLSVEKEIHKFKGLPVHIWGAVSSPGLGTLSEVHIESLDGKFIVITDRLSTIRFCEPGDSGAIVCANDRTGRFVHALGMIVGEMMMKGGTSRKSYLALQLHAGLETLSSIHGSEFRLVNHNK